MIRISAKRKEGFRRCGMFHPHEPVEHPDDRFSKGQLAALMAEPMLIVEVVEDLGEDFELTFDPLPDRNEDDAPADRKKPTKRGKK